MAGAITVYEKVRSKSVGSFGFRSRDNELPALNEVINNSDISSEVKLGYMEILADDIVGTKNSSRAYGFSRDFMPVLPAKSEFGNKWITLYESILEDGILEPIKVYEYLHKYYVEEGNKRVSVSKVLGAPLIPANVIRIIPKYDGNDEKILMYYEFLEFYNKLPIGFLDFSNRGDYKKFYKRIKSLELGEENLVSEIRFMYNEFKKIYLKYGGGDLDITVSDAFLHYLELYDDFGRNLEKNIKQMWSEFGLEDDDTIELDEAEEDIGIIGSIANLGGRKSKLKVAFVHRSNPLDLNWTKTHDEARRHIEKVFADKIEVHSFFDVSAEQACYEKLDEVASHGYDVIFTTSAAFMSDTIKVSLKYKNTKFLNASENFSSKRVRTYSNRMYEPSFLLGILAGSMTFTDSIGVVLSYPIPEVIRSVNAFTLGGQMVNKDFKLYVKWLSNVCPREEEIVSLDEQFMELGCDVVWHNIACSTELDASEGGLYLLNDKNDVSSRIKLGHMTWDWTVIYEKILSSIFDGTYAFIGSSLGLTERAVSYIWGLRMGATSYYINENIVPESVIKSVGIFERLIKSNEIAVFEGPIRDRDGNQVLEKGEVLSSEKMRGIDFFVEGIVGSIPSIDLMDDSEKLLDILGVKKKY